MSGRKRPSLRNTGKSVHEVAHCHDCKWSSEARTAVRLGRWHSRMTGHRVTAERGLYFEFARKGAA